MFKNSVIVFSLLFMVSVGHANELEGILQQASDATTFVVPNEAELKEAKQYFYQSLQSLETQPNWETLLMEPQNQAEWTVIKECPNAHRGRGLFAIRHQEQNDKAWLLQVPHAVSDRYTEQLAALLFTEGAFKAAQWNTVKRSAKIEHSADTADMAHYPFSYWQAFTQAFAEQYPHGKIIQLHGFESSKRKNSHGRESDMILSAGHNAPPVWLQHTAACLQKALPNETVSLYPSDVRNLTSPQNAQAQWLQQQGHQGFAHIEMSLALRKKLVDSAELRGVLVNCLATDDAENKPVENKELENKAIENKAEPTTAQ